MDSAKAAENAEDFAATPDTESTPVARVNRIASLDFIRGIAVMGILVANIIAFGQPWSAYMWPEAFLTEHGQTSDLLWITQFVLVDGKMRGLFTLLFGAGLALFMERAWARGQSRWLQARRLVWLMMFGLIHFYFIWRGDILFLYGSMGLLAILCLRWKAKTQLMVGIIGYVLGGLAYAAMTGFPQIIADTSFGEQPQFEEVREQLDKAKAEAVAETEAETPIMLDGSYADIVTHTFSAHSADPLMAIGMLSFETLPLMLIGMAIYRFGFFSGGLNSGSMRRWGWTGLILGSIATAAIAIVTYQGGFTYWGTLGAMMAWMHLPRLPVLIGLAALLALYGAHANGWLVHRISAAGRMAFSNYLGTSVLMMLIFHPWAGGLWGELTRPQLYLVVLFAWIVMLLWSKPWLERFRFGPLEWLWRCLTYWKLFPLRR